VNARRCLCRCHPRQHPSHRRNLHRFYETSETLELPLGSVLEGPAIDTATSAPPSRIVGKKGPSVPTFELSSMYLVTCPPVWSRWRRCAAVMPRNWSAARQREPKCRNLRWHVPGGAVSRRTRSGRDRPQRRRLRAAGGGSSPGHRSDDLTSPPERPLAAGARAARFPCRGRRPATGR
jgi:hypothetical protein